MQSVSSIGKQSHFAGPLTLKAGIKYKGKFYDSLGENSESLFIYICSIMPSGDL